MTGFIDFIQGLQEYDRYEEALCDIKEKLRNLQPGEKWTVERCRKGSDALFIITMVRPGTEPDANSS